MNTRKFSEATVVNVFKRNQVYYNEVSVCLLVIYEGGNGLPKMQSMNNESIESTTSNLKLLSGSPDAYEKANPFFPLFTTQNFR